MAKHGNIYIGDRELVLDVILRSDGKQELRSFSWKEIISVKVIKGTNKKMSFIKRPYERIFINLEFSEAPDFQLPIIIDKARAGEDFEAYVNTFLEFSKVKRFKFEDKR